MRLDAWRRIVSDALTVRQAEEIARILKETAGLPHDGVTLARRVQETDPYVREIEASLRSALGARVALTKGRRGGRIVIRFHSDEELEGIIARLTQ